MIAIIHFDWLDRHSFDSVRPFSKERSFKRFAQLKFCFAQICPGRLIELIWPTGKDFNFETAEKSLFDKKKTSKNALVRDHADFVLIETRESNQSQALFLVLRNLMFLKKRIISKYTYLYYSESLGDSSILRRTMVQLSALFAECICWQFHFKIISNSIPVFFNSSFRFFFKLYNVF